MVQRKRVKTTVAKHGSLKKTRTHNRSGSDRNKEVRPVSLQTTHLPGYKPYQPLLTVCRNDQDSDAALEMLRAAHIDVRVSYVEEKDDETITPWLITQLSSYYGVNGIRDYLNHWRELTAESVSQ